MKYVFVTTVALGMLLLGVNGLICWNCNHANSHKECLERGRNELCQIGKSMTCATEIRKHDNRLTITKSCQQTAACLNNKRQNTQPSGGSTQCNTGKNSVCRCCCNRNYCNKRAPCPQVNVGASRCALLPTPEDGTKNCTYSIHEGEIGSRCTFGCDEGFLMNGKREAVCLRSRRARMRRAKPKFSIKAPTCEEMPPPLPTVEAIAGSDFGLYDCSNKPPAPEGGGRSCISSEKGVVCQYFCKKDAAILGSGIVLCTHVEGWDHWTPECEPRCPELPLQPENGFRECAGEGKLGSMCEFFCNPEYDMVGSQSTECVRNENKAVWNPAPPKCIMPTCSDLGLLKHGEIDCNESIKTTGTVCEARCIDEGYKLKQRNVTQIECLPNGGWSDKKPCCSRTCPPYAEMDAVIIMDSSMSMRQEGWDIMTSIVMDVIGSFSISDTSAHFAVFRFNNRADAATQILFGDFPNDVDGLLEAVEEIPYSGSGTYIGEALYHAKEVLKSDNREHYRDMIWVLTDGISRDNVTEVSLELRNNGVEIFALGIPQRRRKISVEQLLSIGGDSDHVYIVDKDLKTASDEIINVVTKNICDAPCK